MKSKLTITHDKMNCKAKFSNGEGIRFSISRNGETYQMYPSKETSKEVYDASKQLFQLIQIKYKFNKGENNLDRMNRFANDMNQLTHY